MLVQPVRHPVSRLLREPEIPGARLLDSSTDVWAINRAAALDNFPINGLKVYVPAWSSMGKGDKVELLFNGQVVNQHIITDDAEVGQRVTLWVEPRHWLTGAHTLAYRVTRFNQGAETFTPALKLYAKLEIPAGQDLNPEEGSHSNLYLFIDPAIVENIVDKEIAAAGVDIIVRAESGTGVPYPDAAVGDVIVLSWGGVLVESAPLTAEQISDPATHPIVIHVDEATILAAGDTDISGLAVTFRVRDVVHNYSQDWCKATRLVVMTGVDFLDAPVVQEAVNNVLDLDALGEDDITGEVWAKAPAFEQDDRIILKMRGTTVDNEAVEVIAPAQTVDNLPHTYKVILSNADVRQLAKTQVTFSYRVERPGVTDPLPSKGQFVTFIGEPKHLAAPKAEDEQNGAIDPDLPHPRVRIPFDPIMQQGMAIDLIWAGTRPDTGSYTPELDWYFPTWEEIEAQQDFFIAVDGRHLKTLEGGTLELSYYLLREGPNGEVIRRESLHAALLQVGEPQLELVKPIVLGEQDGALEPGDLPGGIGKLTAPRPTVKPTQSGDIVTYTWTGEVTGTTEDSVTLNGLSKDKDVHFTLNATFVAEHIEPNRGKKVTVSYRIWRAATSETSYSNVLEFGVGQAIGQLLPPAVKEADGGTRLDPLNAQTHLTAVVNYDGMLVGDQITAIWTGADGTLPEGSHTTAPWPVTTLGPQEIPLEPKVVAFSLGKAVTVNYKVTRGSSSPMPSDSLTLSVLPLPENVLDKPLILQAADNGEGAEFDVSQLTDNAVIQVNAWPFIALKQFVWLRVQGTNNDDSPYAQTFWQPPLSQTNETWITQGFYTHPIPFNELKNLRDGSELKVEFKAGLSGSQDENNALPFQVRTYTVKAVEDVKPAITRLTDSNGDEIAEGGSTVDTSITLTGTASKGQKIDVLDGTVSKGQPTADSGTGVWTLLVSGLSAGAHSFTAKALYGSGQSSAPRTLTVAVAVTPAIDSVTDSKGPVAQGGITFDRSVTVTGKASPNQKVRLLDGTTSLGEPTANGSGIWTQVVSALTVKAYSLKALALYGEGEESAPPFTFTVAVAVTPAIDSVTDSKGPVAQGGITFDRSVTVTGKASPNQKVRLLDGTTSLGEPTANGSGIWTQVVSALTVKAYSLKALALYGEGEESAPPFTFTVAAALKPAIDLVTDSKGPVAQGGITFDRSVTVTGKASPNQKVRLLDGTNSLGEPTANGSGIWTQVVSALTVKAYSLKALALYGEGEESAPPFTFTVAVAVTPAIDSVTDSKGPVAQGGITFDRSVTVTGKASPNQKVRLLDGTTSLGEPTANGSGIWTQVVSALTVKAYSLKALALYGEGEESAPPFTFTVAVEDKPTIDSVKGSPSGVEIPNSGTSFETSVTLTGTASKGQKVQVLDGTTPKGQPTADATTGIWTLTDTGLALGPHSFTAKALYGSEQTSAARTFEIKPFVSFEDFQSLPEKELFLNEAPLETPALFLSLVQFQANGYAVVARFSLGSAPGKLEGNCIQGSGARVRLELKAPCSQVSFWQWTGDCTAVIYGVGGEILGEELLVSGESPVKSTFTFFGIKRIELIFRGQYCIVDTFSFSL